MCGITGIWVKEQSGRAVLERLLPATRALQRRGPDDEGTFTHGRCGLGHRRLSILDTSSAGHQPMSDTEGRFVLVFNGEIFNFREIRRELETRGHVFHTGTDTEVLLCAYRCWGIETLHRLNGFFALAIYDREREHLLLARDRMGIKPLLYVETESVLGFASEMKALYAMGFSRTIDPAVLFQYLQLNYIPGEAGIYKGWKRLEPGCCIELDSSGSRCHRWWDLPQRRDPISDRTGDPASSERQRPATDYNTQQEQLREILRDSVRDRLVSDVPLGAFLSGGIDSSVVVALASEFQPGLSTFSIGYRDEPYFDETRYAELVATRYQTNHTVYSLTNDDLFAQLFDTIDQFDQPFADSSALAVSMLSSRVRQKVTVALSGDGADELFAGYHKHMGHWRAASGGLIPELIRVGAPLWQHLPQSRHSAFGNRIRQLSRFAEGMALSPGDRYWRWCSFVSASEAAALLHPQWRARLAQPEEQVAYTRSRNHLLRAFDLESGMDAVLHSDQRMVLPGDMLHKVDSMSMAHSLEVRVPFLDHRVVDFAARLPVASKITQEMKKRILQDAFRSQLPEELYRRPKHGFEVPLLKWFRRELRSWICDDLLSDSAISDQGIFDPTAVEALLRQLFSNNPGEVQARIWGLLVFQHWYKKWHLA